MSPHDEVALCGEGPVDIEVARRLVIAAGGVPGPDLLSRQRGRGKAWLDARLPGLNAGAEYRSMLVLRDLDQDAACAGALVRALLPRRHRRLCLRVAVRAVEAWLLADTEAFARYARIRRSAVPRSPELLPDPKRTMINAWATSRDPELRRIAVSSPVEMQLAGARTAEFVRDHWDPVRAAETGEAPSLARTLRRLREAFT